MTSDKITETMTTDTIAVFAIPSKSSDLSPQFISAVVVNDATCWCHHPCVMKKTFGISAQSSYHIVNNQTASHKYNI
jgi:hypothetical protein